MAEAEDLHGPVARGEARDLDETRSLRTLCPVLKCLDFILTAVGSFLIIKQGCDTIRFFFDKNNSGCSVKD